MGETLYKPFLFPNKTQISSLGPTSEVFNVNRGLTSQVRENFFPKNKDLGFKRKDNFMLEDPSSVILETVNEGEAPRTN